MSDTITLSLLKCSPSAFKAPLLVLLHLSVSLHLCRTHPRPKTSGPMIVHGNTSVRVQLC